MNPLVEQLAELRRHRLEIGKPVMYAESLERRTFEERVFYPAHDPRTESAEFARVRRAMIHDEDQPCRICGVRQSTLGNKRVNTWAATQMEAHHCVIEWAFTNLVDLVKFQRVIVAPRAAQDPAKYGRKFTKAAVRAWIDHDRDNLQTLCDVHHRHKYFGVHAVTGPVWEAQRVVSRKWG